MVVEKISGSAEHKSSHIKYIANSNISPALLPAPNIAQWLSEKKVEQSAEKSLDHILQLSVNIVTLQQSRFIGYHSLLIPVLFISSLVEHIYKYTFLDNRVAMFKSMVIWLKFTVKQYILCHPLCILYSNIQ